MGGRPAKGGGRWVTVPPERVRRWIDGFAGRHGSFEAGPEHQVLLDRLVAHVTAERTVGVVLVRMGGYAAGVFRGSGLVVSKVGSRLVQGRTAAGGWSQQRFARRRQNQADKAFDVAADT